MNLLLWCLHSLSRPPRIVLFFSSTVTRNDSFKKKLLQATYRGRALPADAVSSKPRAKYNHTLRKLHQSSCQYHLCIVYFSGRRETQHLSTVQPWILRGLSCYFFNAWFVRFKGKNKRIIIKRLVLHKLSLPLLRNVFKLSIWGWQRLSWCRIPESKEKHILRKCATACVRNLSNHNISFSSSEAEASHLK